MVLLNYSHNYLLNMFLTLIGNDEEKIANKALNGAECRAAVL